jgi:hypothetical protein
MVRRVVLGWALACAVAVNASAQSGPSGTSTDQSQSGSQTASSSANTPPPMETRPATNTFFGDTGLWFVPTAEVLPDGKWSGSVYRRGTNWQEGYTNVGDFAGTFAYGLKGRAEIFGSFLVDTRIDRDTRPLFLAVSPEPELDRAQLPRKGSSESRSARVRSELLAETNGSYTTSELSYFFSCFSGKDYRSSGRQRPRALSEIRSKTVPRGVSLAEPFRWPAALSLPQDLPAWSLAQRTVKVRNFR